MEEWKNKIADFAIEAYPAFAAASASVLCSKLLRRMESRLAKTAQLECWNDGFREGKE